jgi:hypothetical protein
MTKVAKITIIKTTKVHSHDVLVICSLKPPSDGYHFRPLLPWNKDCAIEL